MAARPVFRIIGGQWRGRKIRFPASVRASGSRVRESLFNCLGKMEGRNCLDLFAGAGALALEAASRGANSVVCVERSRTAARALRESADTLNANSVAVHARAAASFLKSEQGSFDVIFMDPPFSDYADDAAWGKLLNMAAAHVAPGGVVYCESDRHFVPPAGWRSERQKNAGSVFWQLLQR